MSQGIPLLLLQEAVGHRITVELNDGDVYTGKLNKVEPNMNIYLHEGVVGTAPNGQSLKMDTAFIRGSNVLYVSVPEMFENAPLFQTGDSEAAHKPQVRVKRTYTTIKIRKQSQ